MSVSHAADQLPSEEEVRSFHEHGVLVTPVLFSEEELRPAREEMLRAWERETARIGASGDRGAGSRADYSRVRPELQRLHATSPVFADLCRDPRLVRIAGALLGPDVDLSWNQGYTKAPGDDPRTEIPWHQDEYYAQVDGGRYNCWLALGETTVLNGTIVHAPVPEGRALLPHVWDERLLFFRCEVDARAETVVELAPGQAFLFTGHVPHRSMRNRSSAPRVAYSISYSAASARLRANGEAFGDRVPVLREGRLVDDVLHDFFRAGEPADHLGARIVDELSARAPGRTDELGRLREGLRRAVADGDDRARRAATGALLALLPRSEEALGDLVRARGRVDQLWREFATVRGTRPEVERLLVDRILELDATHEPARAERARLGAVAGDALGPAAQRGTK